MFTRQRSGNIIQEIETNLCNTLTMQATNAKLIHPHVTYNARTLHLQILLVPLRGPTALSLIDGRHYQKTQRTIVVVPH